MELGGMVSSEAIAIGFQSFAHLQGTLLTGSNAAQ
jgi:hypothetical protein